VFGVLTVTLGAVCVTSTKICIEWPNVQCPKQVQINWIKSKTKSKSGTKAKKWTKIPESRIL